MKNKLIYISVILTIASLFLVITNDSFYQTSHVKQSEYNPKVDNVSIPLENPPPVFVDLSIHWNLVAQHSQTSKYLSSFSETLGAGICILDVNSDGWMDVFTVGGSGFTREYGKQSWWHKTSGNKLFINQNGLRLFDVTERSGINEIHHGFACSVADLDTDGDMDIIISGIGGVIIYSNDGMGHFTKVDVPILANSLLWTTQVAISDVNRDGLLDLYTTNFVEFKKGAKTFENNQGFETHTAVNFEPTLYDPQANQLFINRGNFTFELTNINSPVANGLGRSMGARWHDFNGDGHQDLLVLNDFNTSNRLYLADDKGAFTEAQSVYRNLLISGNKDLIINENSHNNRVNYYFTRSSGLRNILLEAKNKSDKQIFSDQADYSNLSKSESLFSSDWGAVQADLNNDGRKDIYIASGRPDPDPDSKHIAQAQPNRFYLNLGNGRFHKRSGEDSQVAPKSSRSVVSVDLDNDGKLEVIVANNNDFVQVLGVKNQVQHHWIGFSFPASHKFLGAKISLLSGQQEQIQRFSLNQNLFSQSDPRLHFGLGLENSAVNLKIELPSGKELQYSDLPVDRYYSLNPNDMQLTEQVYPVESPSLVTNFEHVSADESLLLARLILQTNGKYYNDIKALWAVSEPSVQQSILQIIEDKEERNINPLLFDALGQKDIELVLKAIGILKNQELEYSISWLIPLIEHKESRVVCAVAEAFQFFFEEEEAVLFRKKLSIAPMLKSLPKQKSDAQICILKALAASESNRAVPSLLKLLNQNLDNQVTAQLIRTLGLIRDSRATHDIVKILTKHLSNEVNVESLIALSRLNYSGLEELFFQHYEISEGLSTVERRIYLMGRLKDMEVFNDHAEKIVIPSTWLTDATRYLLEETVKHENHELIVQLLKTISSSKNKTFYTFLSVYLKDDSELIQKEALQAAISLSEPRQSGLHETVLAELPIETQERLVVGLKEQHGFSKSYIQYLSDKYLKSPDSRPVILSIVKLLQQHNVNHFIYLSLKTGTPRVKKNIYEFTLDNYIVIDDIPKSLLRIEDDQATLDFLEWYYQINYEHYDKHILKVRVKLNQIFSNSDLDVSQKRNVFKLAAKRDSFVANQYFDFYLDNLTTMEILKMIDSVSQHERSTKLLNYASSILTQTSSTKTEKLLAAIIIELKTTQQLITYL